MVTGELAGHLMPLLPYAEELLNRGHSITFFHPIDAKFRRIIESCGLSACKSAPYELTSSKSKSKSKKSLIDFMKDHANDNNDDSENHHSSRPDVVVHDFFEYQARDFADSIGVPAVCIFPNLAVTINPSCCGIDDSYYTILLWKAWCGFAMPVLEGLLARLLLLKRNKDRFKRGLPLLSEQDIYPTRYQTRHPRLIIGNTTPAFEFNSASRLPSQLFQMVGPSLPATVEPIDDDLQRWIGRQQQSKKRTMIIYVAFGSMYKHTEKSVRCIQRQLMECCRRNDGGRTTVVVLWSLAAEYQSHLLPLEGDDDCCSRWMIQSHFPQVALFRTGVVDVFVTHCGSNSVSEALLSGIPMVCCPGFADQNGNALRLLRKKVGVIARGGAEGVGTALRQVLDNLEEMKRNAKDLKIAMQNEGGGAVKGANSIENVVNKKSGYEPRSFWTVRRMPIWPFVLSATVWAIAKKVQ